MTAVHDQQMPADAYELSELLAQQPSHTWPQLRDQLADQIDDADRAGRIFDDAESLAIREANITQTRAELSNAIHSAITEVYRARTALAELAGKQLYDMEYTDCAD